jgi:hypothetical protein
MMIAAIAMLALAVIGGLVQDAPSVSGTPVQQSVVSACTPTNSPTGSCAVSKPVVVRQQ